MPCDKTGFGSLMIAALTFAAGCGPGTTSSHGSSSRSQTRQAAETECPGSLTLPVGHTMKRLNVTGTLGESRPIDVELWYPARAGEDCEQTGADREDRNG
jgi:hypothetical protein